MTKKVKLGKSGLLVNPIGLGTNAVGGHNIYPNVDEAAGKALVHEALNNGINLLDTAYFYGPERSEELIGEVLRERGNRSEAIIATKGAHKFVGEKIKLDNSPAFLKKSVEDSLRRIGTDYIDLFYIHFPDEHTPKDEAVGALKKLKDEGKILSIGVSNFSIDQLKEANKDGYVDVYQGEYNLLQRSAEQVLLPYTKEHGISFVPYFPLASGLLTGKYNKNTQFDGSRPHSPHFKEGVFEENVIKVDKVRAIAEAKGVETAHVVLAWYLAQDSIDAVIPGAKRAEQVLNNLKTLQVELTAKDIKAISDIF